MLKQNKYNFKLVCNDKFTPLYNFWYNIKTNNKKLCNKLYKKLSISKTEFKKFRNDIMKEKNPLNQSYYYFIINRCSFSGSTLSGGFSEESSKSRYTKSSIDRIAKLDLSDFEIHNKDFSNFISEDCRDMIFLDPPYYLGKGSKLYGNNGDMHEDFNHEQLYDLIKEKKYWIMTYNN